MNFIKTVKKQQVYIRSIMGLHCLKLPEFIKHFMEGCKANTREAF